MRLAVLGGSFNPIHVGHLALVEAAHKELAYDTVAVIPAFISPFKPAAEKPGRLRQNTDDTACDTGLSVYVLRNLRNG